MPSRLRLERQGRIRLHHLLRRNQKRAAALNFLGISKGAGGFCRKKGMSNIKRVKSIIMDQVSVRVDHSVRRKKKRQIMHGLVVILRETSKQCNTDTCDNIARDSACAGYALMSTRGILAILYAGIGADAPPRPAVILQFIQFFQASTLLCLRVIPTLTR